MGISCAGFLRTLGYCWIKIPGGKEREEADVPKIWARRSAVGVGAPGAGAEGPEAAEPGGGGAGGRLNPLVPGAQLMFRYSHRISLVVDRADATSAQRSALRKYARNVQMLQVL